MAFKPAARKALLVFVILYVITVVIMLLEFRRAARPKNPDLAHAQIQEKLNEVLRDLQSASASQAEQVGDGSDVLAADPEHVRGVAISRKEAAEIFDDYFRPRGSIIGVTLATLIVQILNFGILLTLLYGFGWEPLLRLLDDRRRTVKERLDDAARNREQTQQVLRERREELTHTRRERAAILDQARNVGEQEGDQLVERARREAQRLMRQTHEQIQEEVRAARGDLRGTVVELAAEIAARMLQREVSAKDHERLLEEMIGALGSPGTAERGEAE